MNIKSIQSRPSRNPDSDLGVQLRESTEASSPAQGGGGGWGWSGDLGI